MEVMLWNSFWLMVAIFGFAVVLTLVTFGISLLAMYFLDKKK
jgi:hypothetical protein